MTQAKDQDVHRLFLGLSANAGKRHFLVERFRENYDSFHARLKDNSRLRYAVSVRETRFYTMADY